MIVGKVLEQGLLSVSERDLHDLGLHPGDRVALEIKGSPGSRSNLSRVEKERILNETRGLWSNIPDELFEQIMSEIRDSYTDWDRSLDASSGRHGDSD